MKSAGELSWSSSNIACMRLRSSKTPWILLGWCNLSDENKDRFEIARVGVIATLRRPDAAAMRQISMWLSGFKMIFTRNNWVGPRIRI